MTDRTATLEETLLRLRREFDESFAAVPSVHVQAPVDLLAIGVGTEHVAVHRSTVTALRVDLPITPVPTPVSSLLGIAGIGGAIVVVHDLAKLLGFPEGGRPRWIAVMRDAPIAFAFASFDRHLRVSTDAIATTSDRSVGPVRGELLLGDGNRLAVIDCEHLAHELTTRAHGI